VLELAEPALIEDKDEDNLAPFLFGASPAPTSPSLFAAAAAAGATADASASKPAPTFGQAQSFGLTGGHQTGSLSPSLSKTLGIAAASFGQMRVVCLPDGNCGHRVDEVNPSQC